jgi:multidrug efflux pump subunit AcrA (membrane-fusion protein)
VDIIRPRGHRIAFGRTTVGVVLVLLIALGAWSTIALLRPHTIAPTIDRVSVILDVARREPLVRSVEASGTFVSTRVAVVAAPEAALVVALAVHPGSRATAGSVIARLSSPDIDADLADLGAQLDAARANMRSVSEQAAASELAQTATARSARADDEQASAQLGVDVTLHAQGLIGDLPYRVARIDADAARDRAQLQHQTIAVVRADGDAKIAQARAQIAELTARRAATLARRDALTVRAGTSGTVQSVAVDAGARVAAGTELVRIADDDVLEAVLAVADTDARGVSIGMPVALTSGSARRRGRVVRIDPAAQGGTVPVHVAFARPDGFARAAMPVDGAIELARLPDAVTIARPAGTSDDAVVDVYKLEPGGGAADRVRVSLGVGSLDRVAVRAGLAPGDTVVISDVTAAQDAPRILLR